MQADIKKVFFLKWLRSSSPSSSRQIATAASSKRRRRISSFHAVCSNNILGRFYHHYGGCGQQHSLIGSRRYYNITKYCCFSTIKQQQPTIHDDNDVDDDNNNANNNSKEGEEGVVRVYNALNFGGCMDYSKSWAWQHVLLNRRLHQRRLQQRQQQQSLNNNNTNNNVNSLLKPKYNYDYDSVLLLEHNPVYTLGRGANENHLTFVAKNDYSNNSITTTINSTESIQQQQQIIQQLQEEVQQKLSRKVRGPGTARLAIDRSIGINHQSSSSDNNITSVEDSIQEICNNVSPVIAPNGVPIYRVERGGEVTYHGPSQLVVYPLLDLLSSPTYKKDLHWYLRMVEEVVIQTLMYYNIESHRDAENTGVWVGDEKIAAVGISSSRWITTHGFALNVDPDLSYFDTSVILPCGIEGKGVTSIAKILRQRYRNNNNNDSNNNSIPTIQEVAGVVIQTMEDVFGISLIVENEKRRKEGS